MCTQKPPHDFSQQLYERYREAFNEYISSKVVLPALGEKSGEFMLKELVRRWDDHKVMVRWLSRFFNYLDRYYIQRHNLAQLKDVGALCFRDLVYAKIKGPAKDAVLALVDKERDGEQIDRALVKDALGIFVEMGMGGMEAYESDFEAFLLTETAKHYARKASLWIEEDSCPAYLIKAERCLGRGRRSAPGTTCTRSSEAKLLKEVEREALATYETRLLEKEHSGCAALLRDDKTEDLARMFRLFKRGPHLGLPPVAEIFKKTRRARGPGAAVKQADEVAASKKEAKTTKAAGGAKDKDGVAPADSALLTPGVTSPVTPRRSVDPPPTRSRRRRPRRTGRAPPSSSSCARSSRCTTRTWRTSRRASRTTRCSTAR